MGNRGRTYAKNSTEYPRRNNPNQVTIKSLLLVLSNPTDGFVDVVN